MAAAASTSAALSFANLASSRSASLTGSSPLSSSSSSCPSLAPPKSAPLSCRCQKSDPDSPPALSRRTAFSILAAAAAISSRVSPADAAYGEAANIFGSAKVDTGFVPVSGNGFKLSIPSKWNPSKEVEFPGTVLRYEDNFDSNTNVAVMVLPAAKVSIKEYGSPEKFLEDVSYLLGKQAYGGKTRSEGGFDRDAVVTAAILESYTPVVNGKDYYSISVLTRTADGGEGGKHHVIVGTVSGGKLYLLKAQAGDKRWFKGVRKFIEGAASSFNVA